MMLSVAVSVLLLLVEVTSGCYNPLRSEDIVAQRSVGLFLTGSEPDARFGTTVTAGDINCDGRRDVVISSPRGSGVVVVFGRNSTQWQDDHNFNFNETSADSANHSWIRITTGEACSQYLTSMAIGDFNGDRCDDLALGTLSCDIAFVVSGHSGLWTSFNISSIGTGDVSGMTLGMKETPAHTTVSNAGDINGDGIDDLLVGEGVQYSWDVATVMFGNKTLPLYFNTSNTLGADGFRIVSSYPYSNLGAGLYKSAGDVNGDGVDDMVLGADTTFDGVGLGYVIFGRNVSAMGQWDAELNVSLLNGTNGFAVIGFGGSRLGWTARGVGDINDDGFADVAFGSAYGRGAWIVFGHAAPWEPLINASMLNGADGFHLVGTFSAENLGLSNDALGDFNGDGIDDFAASGEYSRDFFNISQYGTTLVIFGHRGPWPASINHLEVSGSIGFQIDGTTNSHFGSDVCGTGDLNEDGLADLAIGVPFINGTGAIAIVFGVYRPSHCVDCNIEGICSACENGFALSGNACALPVSSSAESIFSMSSSSSSLFTNLPSSPSSSVSRATVVVVINFFDEDVTGDENELEQEIADALGIDVGLVSVVVVTPTQVQVTIVGETLTAAEATASQLVSIINNGNAGSAGSTTQLLRKAIDAHIRHDEIQSSNDDVNAVVELLPFSHCIATTIVIATVVLTIAML